jgi:SNF2 family DNA or RNA helicase
MGLGKTVQALAAIAHVTQADSQRHHVVVCPASLIDTWLQEIRRALTGIRGWRFHGTDRDAAFGGWQAAGGILVTSYQQAEHLLTRDRW